MPKGKIKEYDANHGYGSIISFDTGQELSVYANFIILKEGETFKKDQEVEYELDTDQRRNWAVNVRIL